MKNKILLYLLFTIFIISGCTNQRDNPPKEPHTTVQEQERKELVLYYVNSIQPVKNLKKEINDITMEVKEINDEVYTVILSTTTQETSLSLDEYVVDLKKKEVYSSPLLNDIRTSQSDFTINIDEIEVNNFWENILKPLLKEEAFNDLKKYVQFPLEIVLFSEDNSGSYQNETYQSKKDEFSNMMALYLNQPDMGPRKTKKGFFFESEGLVSQATPIGKNKVFDIEGIQVTIDDKNDVYITSLAIPDSVAKIYFENTNNKEY